MNTHDAPRLRAAFTLVELLVVLGIIAVLVGILLPVLGRSRMAARQVTEMAASRQLITAYISYATENKGRLLPGHQSDTPALEDDQGRPLSPAEAGKRWPWRLVNHARSGVLGMLLVNERADALAARDRSMWAYSVSLTPSLGLNYHNLGGDLTSNGANDSPGCIRRISEAREASRLIVFASARSMGGSGAVDGHFRIEAPTRPGGYSAAGWSPKPFDPSEDPGAWGFVHPRWNGRAVVACLDGHSQTLSLDEMRDMTRWSVPAAVSGNQNWTGK